MLNDKLPVVVVVPARPQAPSLSLVPTFRLVPSFFPSSFNTLFLFRFRFLLLALMKPLFAFRQFSFCCFHFICLYCLGRKRERESEGEGRRGMSEKRHSLTNYLESIYLSRAIQTSNCYDTFQSPFAKQTRQFNSQKQAKLSAFYG